MREDLEQQEQMAAIKGFWRDNGRIIFAVVLVIALGFGGDQGYQAYAAHQGEKASRLLTQFEQAIAEQNATKAEALATSLASDHKGSMHHALAAMRMAKSLVGAGSLDKAAQWLEPIKNHSDEGLAWIARLRLSSLYIDLNQLEKALSVLNEAQPVEAMLAQVSDRRGDVLVLLGRNDEARAAWKEALAAWGGEPPKSAAADLVSRKLASLPSFMAEPAIRQ